MNSLASNSLDYKGIVTVTLNKGNKSYSVPMHNAGTEYLGEFISKALACYYVNNVTSMKKDAPTWFSLEYQDSSKNWQPLLKNVIPLTGTTYGKESSDLATVLGKVRFVIPIQSSSVIIRTGIANRNIRISLYNNRIPKEILATIEGEKLGDDINVTLHTLYDALTSGQDAMINWIMFILNQTK